MALIVSVAVFLLGVVGSAMARQLADEFKAWNPAVVRRLIRRAVARLPERQQARFREEWYSHVNEIPGEIGKLITAFGFLFAARKMGATLASTESRPFASTVKRSIDLVAGSALLLFTAPVLATISLAVMIEMGGPVVSYKWRAGLGGKLFKEYSFRLPRALASRGNSSLTPVGHLLRKFSLETLPMLFNLVGGNLALVGPRAEAPEVTLEKSRIIPAYTERLRVKPGITGWAQVNMEGRVDDPVEELAYDRYYIRNRTIKLDLLILYRTLLAILPGAR